MKDTGVKILLFVVGGIIGGVLVYKLLEGRKTVASGLNIGNENDVVKRIENLEYSLNNWKTSVASPVSSTMASIGMASIGVPNNKEASYNNKEEWIVRRNKEGKIEGITVNRDAKKVGV